MFFFEKKNQKTFVLGYAWPGKLIRQGPEVFCCFSSEKQTFLPNLILRARLMALATALRALLSDRPIETILLAAAVILWFAWQTARLYAAAARCTACAAPLHAHPIVGLAAVMATAAVCGLGSGRRTAIALRTTITAPWLVVLPWPDAHRRRDIRQARAVVGAAGMVTLTVGVACLAHVFRVPYPLATSTLAAAAYATAFWLGSATTPAVPLQADATQPTKAPRRSLLDRLDQMAPAHASRWAWSGHLRPIAAATILLLIPFGGASAAVSLTRHETAMSFGIAILGGNLAFLLALRPGIVAATVFRTAPLAYARALAAVTRAPLLLSCGAFALIAAVPLASDAASWRMLPGMQAALLLLNGLYTACAAFRPVSPRQALLLYAGGLYGVITATTTGGVAHGLLALVVITGIAAVLVRRAGQDWRAGHG
jgi:hypothetical protein